MPQSVTRESHQFCSLNLCFSFFENSSKFSHESSNNSRDRKSLFRSTVHGTRMHRPYMTSRRARNTFCRVPGETYQLLSRQLQVHGHIRETSLDGAGGCGVGVLCFTPHVSCPATVLRGSLSTLIIERKEMTRKSSAFHCDEKLEKQIAGVWDFGGIGGHAPSVPSLDSPVLQLV